MPCQQEWCLVYGETLVASTLPYYVFTHRALYVQILIADQTCVVRDEPPTISTVLAKLAKSNTTGTFQRISKHVLTP